jgi:hypothetical protein
MMTIPLQISFSQFQQAIIMAAHHQVLGEFVKIFHYYIRCATFNVNSVLIDNFDFECHRPNSSSGYLRK